MSLIISKYNDVLADAQQLSTVGITDKCRRISHHGITLEVLVTYSTSSEISSAIQSLRFDLLAEVMPNNV